MLINKSVMCTSVKNSNVAVEDKKSMLRKSGPPTPDHGKIIRRSQPKRRTQALPGPVPTGYPADIERGIPCNDAMGEHLFDVTSWLGAGLPFVNYSKSASSHYL